MNQKGIKSLKCITAFWAVFVIVAIWTPLIHAEASQYLDPPEGADFLSFDSHGNYWTLVSGELYVLPAQASDKWVKDELSNLPKGGWTLVVDDTFGNIAISDGKNKMLMDPHHPEKGWKTTTNDLIVTNAPWMKNWKMVGCMPGGAHDLGGEVLDGKFYMDWSITGDFGYQSKSKVHNKLLEFNPVSGEWKIVADYGLPRGYCGVGVLDGKVWTVAGDALRPDGERYHSKLCQIYDPVTDIMSDGPTFPAFMGSALALSYDNRLYIMGFGDEPDKPLKLYSIGKNEKKWQVEPEGPVGLGASYGTELDGKLYTVVGHRYIAIFDTATKKWETTVAPHSPRSPALSHYKGEVWVMGGRTKEGGSVSYIYNPKSKEWRKGIDLPREIVWGCAFNIDGVLYLTGGAGVGGYNNRTFELINEEKE
jgi:hypothetical protein